MIERLRNVDERLRRIGARVKKDVDLVSEVYRGIRYEVQKEKIDGRLDHLGNEIMAGAEFIAGIEDAQLKSKLSIRIEGLVSERVNIVQSLPQYAKEADLEKVILLKDETAQRIEQEESEQMQSPLPPRSEKRNLHQLPIIINEGPVKPRDLEGEFRKVKIVAPVAGGSTGAPSISSPGPVNATPIRTTRKLEPNQIHPTHWDYVGSNVDPAVDARWTDNRRKKIVTDIPADPNRGRLGKLWDKMRGRDKVSYRPYDEQDVIRYKDDPSDPTKDSYFVRERSSKNKVLAAVAGTAALAWILHEAPPTRAGLENIGILSPSYETTMVAGNLDVNTIRSNIRAEMEAQRPVIVQEVTDSITPVARQELNTQRAAIVEEIADRVRPLSREEMQAIARDAALAMGRNLDNAAGQTVNLVQSLDIPVRDLRTDEVEEGNLSVADGLAERLTGRSDHSFLNGMADYLIMERYQTDWGLQGGPNLNNPSHIALLNNYKFNAATQGNYLKERDALKAYITSETQQRYPGQTILRWAKAGDSDELMMLHKTANGSVVVPMLPDFDATKDIMDKAKAQNP